MSVPDGAGGLLLGGQRPIMPEITICPVAQLDIAEDGCGIGDATHHLKITLPANARELRIPLNPRALRTLGLDVERAGGVTS